MKSLCPPVASRSCAVCHYPSSVHFGHHHFLRLSMSSVQGNIVEGIRFRIIEAVIEKEMDNLQNDASTIAFLYHYDIYGR